MCRFLLTETYVGAGYITAKKVSHYVDIIVSVEKNCDFIMCQGERKFEISWLRVCRRARTQVTLFLFFFQQFGLDL